MAKFCTNCGSEVRAGLRFCTKCGTPVQDSAVQQQPPQPPVQQQPQQFVQQQRPQQFVPVQPPQQYIPQPPAEKKSKKGLIIGIVAGVLALALGVTGWLGFREGGFLRGGEPEHTESADKPAPAVQTPADKPTVKPAETPKEQEDEPPVPDTPSEPEVPPVPDVPETPPAPDVPDTPDVPETPPVVAPVSFDDVSESDWFYDPVQWAASNGIVTGSSFYPDGAASRAQALTFLWRAKGMPAPSLRVSPFTDVKEGDYFFEPVLWAFENGLISLSGDGRFHADDPASRAQAVTFLYRAEGSPEVSGEPQFSDVGGSDWFAPQAIWALEKGLLSSGGAFYPDADTTRAMYVTFLYRLYA